MLYFSEIRCLYTSTRTAPSLSPFSISVTPLSFNSFRDKELDAVAALLRYQLFEPGEVMLEAGDLATALFILFDGEADQMDPLASPTSTSVSSPSSSGAAGVVRLPAKSFFGAEGLKGSPAPYTVVAAGTEGMPPVGRACVTVFQMKHSLG
jgi:CRP-like cAMP-binding protein